MVRHAIAALSLLIAATPAGARHVQTTKVRYETESGHSQWYAVDVTYLAGAELNEATHSFRFDGFKPYAVTFWDKREATVIKINSFMVCGMEVTADCLPTFGKNERH